MKVCIASVGSHGDVRSFIILADKLIKRGDEVIVFAPIEEKDHFLKIGAKFIEVSKGMSEILNNSFDKIMSNQLKSLKTMINFLKNDIPMQFEIILKNLKNVDIMFGGSLLFAGRSIAEYLNIPYHHVVFSANIFPSEDYPPLSIKNQFLPRFVNKFLWAGDTIAMDILLLNIINKERKKLGLNKIKSIWSEIHKGVIVASDKTINKVSNNLMKNINYIQTGYWHYFQTQQLDKNIEDFINSSKKLIYFGFGSMGDHNPKETVSIINKISKKGNVIFFIGNRDYSEYKINNNVLCIRFSPHHLIFPKMDVVIHHGGMGTTTTAAYSGVPQIIVPHVLDQFQWTKKIKELKFGPSPIKRKGLNGEKLCIKIEEVFNNKFYLDNAQRISKKMQKENGINNFLNSNEIWGSVNQK